MTIQLTTKERMYLEDGKSQEEICIQKYQNYANQASDSQLKQLFNTILTQEQHHLDTINKLLQGQDPNLNNAQNNTQNNNQQVNQGLSQGIAMNNQADKVLCSDLLATEKYVSGVYDTAIFEAANPVVRQAIQHIQKEEQGHGEQLFNYMNSHGMYSVK